MIRVSRVYEAPSEDDGLRILVDRLWPRGLTKERAAVDVWLKEIAPSTELRKRYHADHDWDAFRADYLSELEENQEACSRVVELAKSGTVTLLYGIRDAERNHALLIRELLAGREPTRIP